MKRIITSAFVIMLTIGAAQAQTTSPDKQGHKKEHKMAFDNLNLSADQKARLQSLREDYQKQSADLKNNTQLNAEEKQSRRKALHEQFKSQTNAIFTPAQKEQLAKNKAQWQEKNKDAKKEGKRDDQARNNRGKGMQRGQEFQKELGLSTDQQQKMEQLRNDFRNKFSSLRSDNSLTEDQKKAKMQEMRKQQQTQMKSILTPEQIQKMESLRQHHSRKNS
jgi:Spy/CpxP family protein refolding chaperone